MISVCGTNNTQEKKGEFTCKRKKIKVVLYPNQNRMKNYLLTIIGEFKEGTPVCKEIAVSISPLVDSQHLKFAQKNGVLFLSFGTEVEKVDIYDYVLEILYGITDTFVLTEITDNLTVRMPDDISGYLFDLELGDGDNSLNMDSIIANDDFDEDFDPSISSEMDAELDSEFIATLRAHLDKVIVRPSLDQILDKINSDGIESLTKFEKNILQDYGKN